MNFSSGDKDLAVTLMLLHYIYVVFICSFGYFLVALKDAHVVQEGRILGTELGGKG